MKQILQNLGSGETILADVPAPGVRPGHVLVATAHTMVSLGTEKMLLEFGRASLLDKARQQPERVKQVLAKIRTDGLLPTLEAVRSKLDQPIAMGYCQAGTVLAVGAGVDDFRPGDRVATNGPHAEVVCVPKHLCARVPDAVPLDAAAFTPLASIALQGVRLAAPTLGESVVVVGLGLVGLLAVQLLRAQGARVLGLDLDPRKAALARKFGAEAIVPEAGGDPVPAALAFAGGSGVDAVLICASTPSSEPVHNAARMCRQRGRIVLVGVTGLELNRADFYEKELTFQVSCSYGPGRYDPAYEMGGRDYPPGFVRWTEQRNFAAVLELMAAGRLDCQALVSTRFSLDRALEGYQAMLAGGQLGILLDYPVADGASAPVARSVQLAAAVAPRKSSGHAPVLAVIGAGNYAGQVLLPALVASGARLRTLVSAGGASASHFGRKFGFEKAATDASEVFADPEVDAVVIATRHDSHAALAEAALAAGKHVFVEKPLCLNETELTRIETLLGKSTVQPLVMVGFNRRFAPLVVEMRRLLAGTAGPSALIATVNAGALPDKHWTKDSETGGGRLLGEGIHFVDLLRHLAGAPVQAVRVARATAGGQPVEDVATIVLEFANGAIGTIHYLANGDRSFPKERIEVFAGGRVLQLDNFRRLHGFGCAGFKSRSHWRQDKGHAAGAAAFVKALREGGPSPIPWAEIAEAHRTLFSLAAPVAAN